MDSIKKRHNSIMLIALCFVTCVILYNMYRNTSIELTVESSEDNSTNECSNFEIEPQYDYTELSYESDQPSFGIDVSDLQGGIDWVEISDSNIEFVMINVGSRDGISGEIKEDYCARYNLQEAVANGFMIGAYFTSSATTKEEVIQEVDFLCDIVDAYPITYPIAYRCDSYEDSEHRLNSLTVDERTDLALLFLEEVENRGYVGMFYLLENDTQYDTPWILSEIESEYRVWFAQYGIDAELLTTERPEYERAYAMWQYTDSGSRNGITEPIAYNTAYFSFTQSAVAIAPETIEKVEIHPEVGVNFQVVNEEITAKEYVNVRSTMNQEDDSNIIGTIEKGTIVTRTGIGINGWSRIIYEDQWAYVISNYMTLI